MLLRANVPAAIASTLVTNPVTFGPIYYAAYRIGATMVGESEARAAEKVPEPRKEGAAAWPASTWDRVAAVGKPLLPGLAILASSIGLLAYLAVTWLWRLKTGLAWRRRRRKPAPPHPNPQQKD